MIYLLKSTKISYIIAEATMRPKIIFADDILDDTYLFEISDKFDVEIIKQKVFHICPIVVLSPNYMKFLEKTISEW